MADLAQQQKRPVGPRREDRQPSPERASSRGTHFNLLFVAFFAHVLSTSRERTLKAAVAGDLLKRENRRSVVMAHAGTHTPEEGL